MIKQKLYRPVKDITDRMQLLESQFRIADKKESVDHRCFTVSLKIFMVLIRIFIFLHSVSTGVANL